ncbi:hypothetical protein DYB28_003570 [Aphanomyces astaci]|uniref:Uncharacterized protein n=1 Tax=Aphanomyces astaci TaxID=112090 RepID=A0A397BK57_APHAT|nr:hypothetical protein DYB36_009136 [Aphanomyces astaci]RHY19545.1 hypothetical protein DYB25_011435 [Aphanomyces astaci]RHY38463.1 hypothetical protein DYB38_010796 [Aphanomyces astaci]RHY46537.1 hypothetical protein DYB30_012076 [Aphanomyces astaci]RHY71866.1 hypothetical protein DYB34_012003 [Aphanomyces astaci]
MMRVFFVAAVAVCATSTKHRWAQDPCVDVEGDARFCYPSSNVCTSTHFGECPTSNTHAEAKCTEDAPSFHPTGTYQGRCVLKVDTHCVERSTGFVCGYMGAPRSGVDSVGEPQRGAGPAQEVGEAQHPFQPVPAGKSHHPFEPVQGGKSRHPSEPDQESKPHHPFEPNQGVKSRHPSEPDQEGKPHHPFEPNQGGKSQHPFEPNQDSEGQDPVEPDQVRITYHPFEHDKVGEAQRPVEEGEKVHQAVVHSDAAAVPTAKDDIKSSSNTVGITVGVVGVAAVAAVAFMAIRKKNSRKSADKPDNLVTPEVPHPDHKAPNLLGSGPLTPSLNAEKSKIFSV